MVQTGKETGLAAMQARVSLVRDVVTIGRGGETDREVVVIATLWAGVARRTLAPVQRGDRLSHPQIIEFTLHHRAAYEAAERVIHEGKSYSILTLEPYGLLEKRMILRCEADGRPVGQGIQP